MRQSIGGLLKELQWGKRALRAHFLVFNVVVQGRPAQLQSDVSEGG